jgi:presqualene diphosphate synthase
MGAMSGAIAKSVRGARSNFYMPMRLMPKQRRAAMFAIYAVARALDDVADGPQTRGEKRAALDGWRRELDAVYRGTPGTPVGHALAAAVARYALPRQEFDALIDGMTMDIDADMTAPPQATLDLYCRRVAGSIGVLALNVFGCSGPAEKAFAVALGRALQLTNIARDLAEDAARGRLYVPREVLDAAGIGSLDPRALPLHPCFSDIRRRLCALAERGYTEAGQTLAACPSRRRLWPALAMMGIYRRILAKLADAPADAQRVRIARHLQLRIALRALLLARP